MNEQYFFVRKLGLGKEVVNLSLVVTEVTAYCIHLLHDFLFPALLIPNGFLFSSFVNLSISFHLVDDTGYRYCTLYIMYPPASLSCF